MLVRKTVFGPALHFGEGAFPAPGWIRSKAYIERDPSPDAPSRSATDTSCDQDDQPNVGVAKMVRAKTERAAGMRTMVAGLLAAVGTEGLRPAATGLAHAANFTVTNTKPSSTPSKDQTGYFLGRPGSAVTIPAWDHAGDSSERGGGGPRG